MAKNIEIQINQGNDSYEILYPLISLLNTTSDLLSLDKTSGNLSSSRISDIISNNNLPQNTVVFFYTGTGSSSLTITTPFICNFILIGRLNTNYGMFVTRSSTSPTFIGSVVNHTSVTHSASGTNFYFSGSSSESVFNEKSILYQYITII